MHILTCSEPRSPRWGCIKWEYRASARACTTNTQCKPGNPQKPSRQNHSSSSVTMLCFGLGDNPKTTQGGATLLSRGFSCSVSPLLPPTSPLAHIIIAFEDDYMNPKCHRCRCDYWCTKTRRLYPFAIPRVCDFVPKNPVHNTTKQGSKPKCKVSGLLQIPFAPLHLCTRGAALVFLSHSLNTRFRITDVLFRAQNFDVGNRGSQNGSS